MTDSESNPIDNARRLLLREAQVREDAAWDGIQELAAEFRAAAEALPDLNSLIVGWEADAAAFSASAAAGGSTDLYDQGKSAGIYACARALKHALWP